MLECGNTQSSTQLGHREGQGTWWEGACYACRMQSFTLLRHMVGPYFVVISKNVPKWLAWHVIIWGGPWSYSDVHMVNMWGFSLPNSGSSEVNEWKTNLFFTEQSTQETKPYFPTAGYSLGPNKHISSMRWGPQCYRQKEAEFRCGVSWQQADVRNTWSWVRSEIRPWHLLQMWVAAGVPNCSFGKQVSVFVPSHTSYSLFKALSSSKIYYFI